MTLSTHDQNLTIICSFFSNYVPVFNFICKFLFFAKNVFFSVLAVEGPLSLLSALECKILEINFYYCPNHDFFLKEVNFGFRFIFSTHCTQNLSIFFSLHNKKTSVYFAYILHIH